MTDIKQPMPLKYINSEDAKLMPLPSQLRRLEEINKELVHSHNTLLLENVQLEAKLKTAREDSQWIRTKDGLPKPSGDEFVIAKFTDDFMCAPGNYNLRPGEVISSRYLCNFSKNYTHWMPFPELALKEQEAKG